MKRYSLLASIAAVGGAVAFQGTYVNLQPSTPGSPQSGHANITGISKSGGVVAYNNTPTGQTFGGDFRVTSDQGRGVLGNASSPTGVTYGGLFQSFSTTGRGIAGIAVANSGFNVGGFFTSNSVMGKGVQGSANATSGLNYGVYGRSLSPAGFALFGEGNVSATGVFSGNGSGLTNVNAALLSGFSAIDFGQIAGANTWTGQNAFSNASNSFSGNGSGLTNMGASNLTFGTLADARLSSNVPLKNTSNTFTASNSFSLPVLLPNGTGAAPSLSFSGDPDTGLFSNGPGILAFATNGANRMFLENNGRVGINEASPIARLHLTETPAAAPVYAPNTQLVVENSGATGIQILSEGSSHVTFGSSSGTSGFSLNHSVPLDRLSVFAGNTFLMVFKGDTNRVGVNKSDPTTTLDVSGTITGSSKNFLIDDPRDPYNSFLRHGCVESDEYKNVYDGVITTDARGFATITLPDWFDALNEKFRYQLTILDESEDFVLAKVSRKIESNQFTIRTSKPNIEVSWQVTGVRKDAYVKTNPLIVEELKGKDHKGKLLNEESVRRPAARVRPPK